MRDAGKERNCQQQNWPAESSDVTDIGFISTSIAERAEGADHAVEADRETGMYSWRKDP